VFQQVLSVR